MKAISILVLVALAAVASATQVEATPYDGLYAWLFNIVSAFVTAGSFGVCLSATHIQSFLWGDGGYAFYACLT